MTLFEAITQIDMICMLRHSQNDSQSHNKIAIRLLNFVQPQFMPIMHYFFRNIEYHSRAPLIIQYRREHGVFCSFLLAFALAINTLFLWIWIYGNSTGNRRQWHAEKRFQAKKKRKSNKNFHWKMKGTAQRKIIN